MPDILVSRWIRFLVVVCVIGLTGWTCPPPAAAGAAPAKQRSVAARTGAAPFQSGDLIPGIDLPLSVGWLQAPADRVVALTLDDGPSPETEHEIAKTLKARGIHATFFLIGERLPGHEASVRWLAAQGHEIGNHSLHHPLLSDLGAPQQSLEIGTVNDRLRALGITPRWLRPPYGDFDQRTVDIAAAAGLGTVLWTIDGQDWKGLSAAAIQQRVLARLHPGAVILLHSTKATTVAALPGLIAGAQAQGYRFVTMSEWRTVMESAAQRHHGRP